MSSARLSCPLTGCCSTAVLDGFLDLRHASNVRVRTATSGQGGNGIGRSWNALSEEPEEAAASNAMSELRALGRC